MFKAFDRWVVRRLSGWCHLFQRWTGHSTLWLLHYTGLVMALYFVVFFLWDHHYQQDVPTQAIDLIMMPLCSGTVIMQGWLAHEAAFQSQGTLPGQLYRYRESWAASVLRVGMYLMLLFRVFMTGVVFAHPKVFNTFRDQAGLWMYWGFYLNFFLDMLLPLVDPLPPCRGKVKDLFKVTRLVPVPVGASK